MPSKQPLAGNTTSPVSNDAAAYVSAKRVDLGCAGHFIAAKDCYWRRHTQVGQYRISSVGNYFPRDDRKRTTIGAGEHDFFETMVFRLTGDPSPENEGCGCREVVNWSELDGKRYATAGEAQAGHEAFVAKYAAEKS